MDLNMLSVVRNAKVPKFNNLHLLFFFHNSGQLLLNTYTYPEITGVNYPTFLYAKVNEVT